LLGLRFNSSIKEISSLNPKVDPYNLIIGSKIKLSIGSGIMIHDVKKGDTLGEIARKYNSTVNMIAAKNYIADPDLIYVGDVLAINETMRELSQIAGSWRDKARNEYRIIKADIVPTGYNTFSIGMSYLQISPTVGMLRDYNLSGNGEIKNNEIKFDVLWPEVPSENPKGIIIFKNGVLQINFVSDNKPSDNMYLKLFENEFTRENP
jgi:LysM repeat protein